MPLGARWSSFINAVAGVADPGACTPASQTGVSDPGYSRQIGYIIFETALTSRRRLTPLEVARDRLT